MMLDDDLTAEELAEAVAEERGHAGVSRVPVTGLRFGDRVVLYSAGQRCGSAMVIPFPGLDGPTGRDQLTPDGWVTMWTTDGRYDLPADAVAEVTEWGGQPVVTGSGQS